MQVSTSPESDRPSAAPDELDLTGITFPIDVLPSTEPFWAAVDRGELVLPRCDACGNHFWYPRIVCPGCGSRDVRWVPGTGGGRIHSYCRHHTQALPHLRSLVPFTTVLVELDEGPRMLGLLEGTPHIGGVVVFRTRPTATDRVVPVFATTPRTPTNAQDGPTA